MTQKLVKFTKIEFGVLDTKMKSWEYLKFRELGKLVMTGSEDILKENIFYGIYRRKLLSIRNYGTQIKRIFFLCHTTSSY